MMDIKKVEQTNKAQLSSRKLGPEKEEQQPRTT